MLIVDLRALVGFEVFENSYSVWTLVRTLHTLSEYRNVMLILISEKYRYISCKIKVLSIYFVFYILTFTHYINTDDILVT